MSSVLSSTILNRQQTSDKDLGTKFSVLFRNIVEKSRKQQNLRFHYVSVHSLYHFYLLNIFILIFVVLVSVAGYETEAGPIS